jgi:hypothetical protein
MPPAMPPANGTNGIIRFFEENNVTAGNEASGGLATHISIYDSALTTSDVLVPDLRAQATL